MADPSIQSPARMLPTRRSSLWSRQRWRRGRRAPAAGCSGPPPSQPRLTRERGCCSVLSSSSEGHLPPGEQRHISKTVQGTRSGRQLYSLAEVWRGGGCRELRPDSITRYGPHLLILQMEKQPTEKRLAWGPSSSMHPPQSAGPFV